MYGFINYRCNAEGMYDDVLRNYVNYFFRDKIRSIIAALRRYRDKMMTVAVVTLAKRTLYLFYKKKKKVLACSRILCTDFRREAVTIDSQECYP